MSLVSALEAPLSISNAIKKASRATGADFSYLLKTASRESAFKQGAKAKTSSAAGLFQFIESTWLKTVKDVGDKFGLDKYTPHIFTTRNGRHYVPNSKLRQEILQLRHNPEISAIMAGAFTQQNSQFIAGKIGRTPSQGELYIAHFLGPSGASDLITLAQNNPNARADRHFPGAARANRSIFYSQGRPRSVKQLYNNLVKDHAKHTAIAQGGVDQAKPASAAPVASAQSIKSPAISKPVVEPINSTISKNASSTGLIHKTSARQVPVIESPQAALAAQGVETKIIEAGSPQSQQAVGLLGQKGSPMVNTSKVASLTHNNLNIPHKVRSAPRNIGSIGQWTTIVEPPTIEKPAPAAPAPSAKPAEEEPARIIKRKSARRNISTREPRLLEQSIQRSIKRAPDLFSATIDDFGSNFWELMGQNG